jgi:hypothetical protein
MNDASARQVIRKVAACLRTPQEAVQLHAGRLGLRLILARRRSQFLELRFELINKALAALRARVVAVRKMLRCRCHNATRSQT